MFRQKLNFVLLLIFWFLGELLACSGDEVSIYLKAEGARIVSGVESPLLVATIRNASSETIWLSEFYLEPRVALRGTTDHGDEAFPKTVDVFDNSIFERMRAVQPGDSTVVYIFVAQYLDGTTRMGEVTLQFCYDITRYGNPRSDLVFRRRICSNQIDIDFDRNANGSVQ